MAGQPIADLRAAARSFLGFFKETEDQDKMGLISFATGVSVDHPLSTYFVTDMTGKISAMTAYGSTNAEDAIAQAGGPAGFTDQTGVPGDQRIKQYLIFFTDGDPTAFRGRFRSNGIDYDAVAMDAGFPGNWCDTVYDSMGYTNSENYYPTSDITATPTGDGNMVSGSPLTSCGAPDNPYLNTRWYIFEDPKYGLHGYNRVQCNIPASVLAAYICNTARSMAIDHAQELKDKNIKIYIIGLGDVNDQHKAFLSQVASGPEYEYYTHTSDQLEAIFNAIAKEIKLRLVS
jgi:hypothetical protein